MSGHVLALAAALALVAACHGAEPATPSAMEPPAPSGGAPASAAPADHPLARWVTSCQAAFSGEDEAAMRKCYAPSATSRFVDQLPPMEGAGVDAIQRDVIRPFWAAFSGTDEPQLTLVSGDKVASIRLFSGVNDGSYVGRPPTKKDLHLFTAVYADVRGGVAVREERYIDQTTVLGQLGLLKAKLPFQFRNKITHRFDPPRVIVAADDDKERANMAVFREQNAAFNRHDIEALLRCYNPGAKDIFIPGHDSFGHDGIRKANGGYFAVSPDVQNKLVELWAAGDWVVAMVDVSGRLVMPGAKPGTPEPRFGIRELGFFLMRNGKIEEQWTFGNMYDFSVDLGWAPRP